MLYNNIKKEDYLLTIRCCQVLNYIDKKDIDEVILWLKMCIKTLHIATFSYERGGGYKQLHYHAVVHVPVGFRYTPYVKYGDKKHTTQFKIHWSRITETPERVVRYINKELVYNNQDDIFIMNIYNYHYFNLDTQKYEFVAER